MIMPIYNSVWINMELNWIESPYLKKKSLIRLKNKALIGTSYLPKFKKRAVTNLKNYFTKNDENLRKPKGGQKQPIWNISQQKSKYFC